MFVLIVGCGRVGSAIAKAMLKDGHEVSVLDEDPEAVALLERDTREGWAEMGGSFTVGTALEIDALREAGIDMHSPEPIQRAFDLLAGYVDRLEALAG